MSMLAEPRSRQKWSHDPRNTNWSNDKTKFGYQMLTKMGWSEGNGLGLNLSGNVNHIKVNKRGSNAGVGLKKSHDDDWISHQDDFNALLNSLNGNPTSETASPVEKMRASRHRYTKFVKSKDLSNASTDDMACIFGQRGKSANDGRDEVMDSDMGKTEVAPKEEELSIKTVESTVSMNDYFAMKMAALKQKNVADRPICINTIDYDAEKVNVEEVCNGKAVKKKKKKKKDEEGNFVVGEETLVDPCQAVKKKRKKNTCNTDEENLGQSPCYVQRKEDNEQDDSNCGDLQMKENQAKDCDDTCTVSTPCSGTTCDDGNALNHLTSETVKKKKKKKKSESKGVERPGSSLLPSEINELNAVDMDIVTKKKKKKKSKECVKVDDSVPCSEIGEEENVDLVLEKGLVKKKKRKNTDDNIVQTCEKLTGEGDVKKKKKKKNKEMLSME